MPSTSPSPSPAPRSSPTTPTSSPSSLLATTPITPSPSLRSGAPSTKSCPFNIEALTNSTSPSSINKKPPFQPFFNGDSIPRDKSWSFEQCGSLCSIRSRPSNPFPNSPPRLNQSKKSRIACFQALAEAGSGRPGGCYLDFPSDILHQTISEAEAESLLAIAAEKFGESESEKVLKVQNSQIDEAVSLLRHAERPLIVFGKGAAFSRAENESGKLVERTRIPFLPTPMGKGLLPDTHELAATAARSLSIGKYDVALVVGARLNWLLHFGEPPKWPKDVKFILVDVSKEEIELRKPHLGLVGDAKLVLEKINLGSRMTPFVWGSPIRGLQ